MQNQIPTHMESDSTRLRDIRERIDGDAYPLNIEQIADKIIDMEIALFNQCQD